MKPARLTKLFPPVSYFLFFLLVPLTFVHAQTKIFWEKAEADPYTHVAFSHSGTMIALGREDSNTSDLLNTSDGTVIRQFSAYHNQVNALVFTPDDQRLITGVGQGGATLSLGLWDVATGTRITLRGDHTNGTDGLSMSADGQYVATSGDFDRDINVWNVSSFSIALTINNLNPETGVVSRVKDVAFSPDGSRIASGDAYGARVWDASSGALLFTIPSGMVTSIAYSPDGLYIAGAVASERAVKLWSAADGTLIRTFSVETAFDFPTIAFSPNGRAILAGYNTGADGGALTFWRVSTGRMVSNEARSGAIISVAFDPTGTRFAYTQFDGLVVLSLAPAV